MAKQDKKWEPVKFLPKGLCPMCHYSPMVWNQYSSSHIFMNEDGDPVNSQTQIKDFAICPACGFYGDIGKDFVFDKELSMVFVTEAQRLYMEQMGECLSYSDGLRTSADLFVGMKNADNPFIKEGE